MGSLTSVQFREELIRSFIDLFSGNKSLIGELNDNLQKIVEEREPNKAWDTCQALRGVLEVHQRLTEQYKHLIEILDSSEVPLKQAA